MTCVQLFQVPLAEGLNHAKPAMLLWKKVISVLEGADGVVSATWAVQEEDEKIAGIATHWKSLEHQRRWAETEASRENIEQLKAIASGPIYEDVIDFPADAGPSLSAPVVELVSWIHHSDKIDKALEKRCLDGFAKFASAISDRSPEAAGGLIGGWGQIEFQHEGVPSRRFTALIGWKSVKAHYDCKLTEPFLENIHWLMENGDVGVEMVHYAYSKSAKEEQ